MRFSSRRRLTRSDFEKLFAGEFKPQQGGRIRTNGRMRTYVREGWKFLSNGDYVVRARTWGELASLMEAGRKSVFPVAKPEPKIEVSRS